MKKIIYIVLDGLGDMPISQLGDKTPLEAAFTPNIDRLAQQGITGLLYPVGKDVAPESDAALISLLGYDIRQYYKGRGPLEACAEGLMVGEGDVALRANFASVLGDGATIKERRLIDDLTAEEAAYFSREINSKITLTNSTFEFKDTLMHRGVLILRGMHSKLSGWITNTDPAYERRGIFSVANEKFEGRVQESKPLVGYEDSLEAKEAAATLNEFTRKVFELLNDSPMNKKRIEEGKFPVNAILSRDAGEGLPKLPSIESLFHIKSGALVQMSIEKAIVHLSGMEIIEAPEFSGHMDVDYPVWAKITLEALSKFDLVYVQIKGPDQAGHEKDYLKKKEIIEAIDKFFLVPLLKELDRDNTIVAVTADHCTISSMGAHSIDPVPILIWAKGIKPDGSLSFSEKAAALGSLGDVKGRELMSLLVKLAN